MRNSLKRMAAAAVLLMGAAPVVAQDCSEDAYRNFYTRCQNNSCGGDFSAAGCPDVVKGTREEIDRFHECADPKTILWLDCNANCANRATVAANCDVKRKQD